MTTPALYPLTFDPVLKDYPWGGRALETRFGRRLPPGIVAESWEIAAHPNGSSTVNAGALRGRTLPQVQALWGEALLGSRNRAALDSGRFPLLVKLLDANRWLSVQVHPDDAYALAHEGEPGKTEMWVVLHAQPGAELIYGFAPGVTPDGFRQAIAAGEVERWLHRMPVAQGDVIFVPAGAIHALGPGLLVAEIQQNSDTTYRIFDWGRPRPLHIDKAMDVLDFALVAPGALRPEPLAGHPVPAELIGLCPYFRTERLRFAPGDSVSGACEGESFEIWGVLEGRLTLEWSGEPQALAAVSWALLPARLGRYTLTAEAGSVALRVLTP